MNRPAPHDALRTASAAASNNATWRVALALAWLVVFSIWFYSFGMPNNRPLQRWMFWSMIPFDLMDLIDPPVEPNAPAWGWLYLGQRIPLMAVAVGVWLAGWALGRLELRLLRVDSLLDRTERAFFAICLGLATISLLMLGLGVVGQLSRWPLLLILLAASGAEAWLSLKDRPREVSLSATAENRRSDSRRAEDANAAEQSAGNWLPCVVLVAVAPFVFCLLLGAMSPQTDFDVIEYHLGGPKEWFQQGRIARLPHNVYTNFPFLTEMLLLSGMVLYGDWQMGALAGQAIIAGFAPLIALGLYATGRRWFSANAGSLAALVWLTTPWAYRISIIAYAEGGLACYMFASLAVGLRLLWFKSEESPATEQGAPQPNSTDAPAGLPLLAGVLAGSAMACKYTGLISAVLPVAVLVAWSAWREPNQRGKQLLRGLALFFVGVGLSIGPWLLKNIVETGNPVYPLAWSIFGGIDRDAAMTAQWQHGHSSHYQHPLGQLWDLPVKLTDVMANNDWHSNLMFALAPIALLAIWRRRVWCVWAYIGWQFLSWFLFTHHIDRFYVPMFPVVALLAGAGAAWLVRYRVPAVCCGLVIVGSILFNAEVMQIQRITGFNAGRMDLKAAEEMVISPSQRWLNEELAAGRLPDDFKVLCVGEAALFHARFPYAYNTVFDRSLFERWFAERTESGSFQLRPTDQIRQTLRERGITHVLVNWAEILRYREPGSYGYTDFAHPDWFAKLQKAGILGPPLPLPERITLNGIPEKKRQQIADWAPSLLVPIGDHSELRAVQIFPVQF